MADTGPDPHAEEEPEGDDERVTPIRPLPARARPVRGRGELPGGASPLAQLVPLGEPDAAQPGRVGADDPAAVLARLALQVREYEEIEKMRDLEISALEQELSGKNAQVATLETELFHANRRADDLDRRWNELAATYEETKERLVECGALLESIHSQAGYGLVVSLGRLLARHKVLHAVARHAARQVRSLLRF